MTDFPTLWQEYGFSWIVLPAIIFFARIVDVSISTLRLMFLARGNKLQASVIGFFEALLWIIIVSQVMKNLDNVMCFIAYAGGFAAGTLVGMKIEERLAIGQVVMRIITAKPADELLAALREAKYGVTSVPAEGAKGPVRLIFMALKRSDLPIVVQLVQKFNPNAFYTVEDIRYVSEGIFPATMPSSGFRFAGLWRRRSR